MQLRAFLPYLLIINGLGHQPVQADAAGATAPTVQTDPNAAPAVTPTISDSNTTDTSAAVSNDISATTAATDASTAATDSDATADDSDAACSNDDTTTDSN